MSKGPLWNGQGKLKLSQSHGLLVVTDIPREFREYFLINMILQGSEGRRKVSGKLDMTTLEV